jgi:hypothetical protein
MARPAPRPSPGQGGRGFRRPQPVPPGTYRVVLTVDGKESSQPLKVEADPAYPNTDVIVEELEDDEAEGHEIDLD